MKQKHLLFEERIIIEEYLNKGISVHQIALKLGRPDSTVVREIVRNRYISKASDRERCDLRFSCDKRIPNEECQYIKDTGRKCNNQFCRGCDYYCTSELCPDFTVFICPKLKKTPFVCNGCSQATHCRDLTTNKYRYQARRAQAVYEEGLRESRAGINLTADEMQKLDDLVSPLLFNGQSIRAIFMEHKDEIPCSESTLYEYVDRCYLTARNIDMPRKVRYKVRYDHGPRPKSFQEFVSGRTYADFKKYIEEYPDTNVWEMDTVIGTVSDSQCLLTLFCRRTSLMIAVLLEKHTQDAVIEALNNVCRAVGIECFQKVFQVILTDRGTEFGNPYAIECDENGEIKTRVYYCDPYCSWQKGMIERNHEFIRMILPKGKSFENLSAGEVRLMMIHINNYPRESLNGATPFEVSTLLLGKDFLQKMGYRRIRRDDVILKPLLLKSSGRDQQKPAD